MWEKMKMKLKCLSRVMLLRCSFQTNGLLYLLILDWHLIDIASKVEIKRNCGAAVYCIYECVYGIGTPLFVGKKKKSIIIKRHHPEFQMQQQFTQHRSTYAGAIHVARHFKGTCVFRGCHSPFVGNYSFAPSVLPQNRHDCAFAPQISTDLSEEPNSPTGLRVLYLQGPLIDEAGRHQLLSC